MSGLGLVRISGGVAAISLLLCGQVHADDPHFSGADIPKADLKLLEDQSKTLKSLGVSRSLYSNLWIWPPRYTKLRVCFFGGSRETNTAIARIAREWIAEDVGLKLDFGTADKPRQCDATGKRENQVRISYGIPGHWSHTGQNAVLFANQGEPSLNLEAFDKMEPVKLGQGNERSIILHTFGHALGLLHEHQSPKGVCENEFDWAYISSYSSGGTFIIPIELENYKKMTGNDVVATEFDPKSIMLEPFPEEFFLKGAASPCFVKQHNTDISVLDRAAVARMYPVSEKARRRAFEKIKTTLQKLIPDGEKGRGARAFMKTVFERQ